MRVDSPPLDPTSEEARRWLEDELAESAYVNDQGLLARLLQWLSERGLDGPGGAGGSLPGWTIWLAVAVGVGILAVIIVRTVRWEHSPTRRRRDGVLDEEGLSATEYRARAAAAFAAADWSAAVLDGFRAIAQSAADRTLLDDLPGRTAHEVGLLLGPTFPAHRETLRAAADEFDAVRYGDRDSSREGARAVLDLDTALAGAQPVLPDPAGVKR